MYFAWLGHYTTALIVPAAVGAIYWVRKEINIPTVYNVLIITFVEHENIFSR